MKRRVFIAGHAGMVGSALLRQLECADDVELVLRTRDQLDLTNQADTSAFFVNAQIDEVYLAAARVGGICANQNYPADFIYQNLMIECNVVHAAFSSGVKKLMLLGSSCIYPRLAEQPMSEPALLDGKLEPTNEAYAIAKIAGIKLCEAYSRQYNVDYRSVMPTNLYGVNDNFHPDNSHVIPGMMRRFHNAKLAGDPDVVVWGSGRVKREFLYVDDMASACLYVMQLARHDYQQVVGEGLSHINIGTGIDCTVSELAQTMQSVIGYQGRLVFDTSKPDGAPRKLLDVARINELGWYAGVGLEEGLKMTYDWFLQQGDNLRGVA